MKILHVNVSNSGGGLEQYLSQLFRELEERDHANFFLAGQTLPDEQLSNLVDNYHIDQVTHLQCSDLTTKLKQVKKILETITPDLIFIHQVLNPQLINLLTSKTPSVRFMHGFKLICPAGSKILFRKQQVCNKSLSYACQEKAYLDQCMPRNPIIGLPLIYKSMKNVRLHKEKSQMVVASDFMKSVLLYNGFTTQNISVIPYFVDMPEIKKECKSNGTLKVLALGRLVKIKGMHHLLKAFCSVKRNAQLSIIGDGPEMSNLKQLTNKYGLQSRVSFGGWIKHNELDEIFRQSDVVVVPSIWPEPFGIVGIEAMSYGKPVVASDVGGISGWCKNGETGYLISIGDVATMAEKINYLLDHPTVAKEFGENGREQVKKKFTATIHLERLNQLFTKVTALQS